MDEFRGPDSGRETHLVVFVHGMAGNPNELRIMKNCLALKYREYEYLICNSLEEDTMSSIEDLGTKVAEEILRFIKSERLEVSRMR